jgi:hypothetical protein
MSVEEGCMEVVRKRMLTFGMAAAAIACCAAWPIIAGLVGGAAIGSEWGEGAFVLVMMVTVGAVVWRVRHVRARRTGSTEVS